MTKSFCFFFLLTCVGQVADREDDRIKALFRDFDPNQDGKLELLDFLKFYEISSLIIPKVVYNNIYALRNIDRI
jgi:hypothetical protein